MNYFKHETAIVDDGALVGEGSKIWHFSHVCSTAIIGKQVSLGQNVFVSNNVVIGNYCKVQNNVSIFEGVTLEDKVFCGPSMVFTNVINPRTFVERKNEYKKTKVKEGASLGANCTILCGNTIGRFALIGAGSVVTKDVPDYALFVGSPAVQVGWISSHGIKLNLPIQGHADTVCSLTGIKYTLRDTMLSANE